MRLFGGRTCCRGLCATVVVVCVGCMFWHGLGCIHIVTVIGLQAHPVCKAVLPEWVSSSPASGLDLHGTAPNAYRYSSQGSPHLLSPWAC